MGMTEAQRLLQDIEAHIRATGMKATTFGRLAVNDGKLVGRLRSGGSVTLKTLDGIRAFIASAARAA